MRACMHACVFVCLCVCVGGVSKSNSGIESVICSQVREPESEV